MEMSKKPSTLVKTNTRGTFNSQLITSLSCVGNPVNLTNGNVYIEAQDYTLQCASKGRLLPRADLWIISHSRCRIASECLTSFRVVAITAAWIGPNDHARSAIRRSLPGYSIL